MSLDASGCTRDTMGSTTGRNTVRWSKSLENYSQFGLWAATRPHEAGIASNRESARHGEYVPEPCTHRPSSQGSRECPKCQFIWSYGKLDNKD